MTTEQCSFAYCKLPPPSFFSSFFDPSDTNEEEENDAGACLSTTLGGMAEGFDCECTRGKAVQTGRRFGSCDSTTRRLEEHENQTLKSPKELECLEQSWEYTCCNVSDSPNGDVCNIKERGWLWYILLIFCGIFILIIVISAIDFICWARTHPELACAPAPSDTSRRPRPFPMMGL